jgi:hydrogenase/urease accessory protein HupE
MYRRIRIKKSTGKPDDQHLHTLIKTKLIRVYFPNLSQNQRNALVAPLVWVAVAALGSVTCVFGNNLPALVVSFGLFVLAYHFIYHWLVSQSII